MKTQILLTACLLIGSLAHSQTRTGHYSQVTTDHFKDGQRTSQTIKFQPGEIDVKQDILTIDVNGMKPQVYTIAKREKPELEDEGQTTVQVLLITTTPAGGLKALKGILLISPKHIITDVMIKRTKATQVSYTFKD